MHLVTVLLKTSAQLFQFHYNQFKDADKVMKDYEASDIGLLEIGDDYGGKALIAINEIAGIILTDLDKEMVAQEAVEWAKYQKDIKLQKKVQESPGSRILQPPSALRA
jgi:hypothetical protein